MFNSECCGIVDFSQYLHVVLFFMVCFLDVVDYVINRSILGLRDVDNDENEENNHKPQEHQKCVLSKAVLQ